MSWRTVVISSRCKLDLKMGYLVVRGEQTQKVFLDEIAMLVIECPAVALTGSLLEALSEKKTKVIFCNNKRSPYAELTPYYGSYDSSRKIKMQTAWTPEMKGSLWCAVIGRKIFMQAEHLKENGKNREAELLYSYIPQIEFQDATNREGHAAKVYFNALFGMDFRRTEDNPLNAALNYGYSILLSAFNRAIVSSGYLTQIGIHHDNLYNPYNLSSDLMEPFRVLTDRAVKALMPEEFSKAVRYKLIDVLNNYVIINNERQTVLNAIDIYVRSITAALNENDDTLIRFFSL